MDRSNKKLAAAGAVVALSLVLSACGSSNSIATPAPTSTATTAVRQEDQFGLGFAANFRADPNSEPASVADSDLVPVTLVAEPITVN